MNSTAKFWNRWAERYSKQPVANEEVYQTKLKRTQAYFEPTMEILEFGCGTGSTAITHAPFVKSIRAIDVSDKMIEIAKAKAVNQGVKNINFEITTLDDLVCEKNSLDVVLGLSILHLLPNWQESIARVHQLLKPSGLFVSSTPCVKNLWWLRILAPLGQVFGLIPSLSFFSTEELKLHLMDCGFEIEHLWQPGKNTAVFIIARKRS
jgi:2-polyprenyl-3-methyl-5-hydroxy-6-metoxy-1,4-benzoquinol methylase